MQTQLNSNIDDFQTIREDDLHKQTFTILIAESVATEKARTNVIRQRPLDVPDADCSRNIVVRGSRDRETLHIRIRRVGLQPNTSNEWTHDSSLADLEFLEYEVTARLAGKFERSILTRRRLAGNTPRLWIGADGYLADTGATMSCAMPDNSGWETSTVLIVDADDELVERDQVRYVVGDYRRGNARRKLARNFLVAKQWEIRDNLLDTTTSWFRGGALISETTQTVGGAQSEFDDGFYWTTAVPNSCHDPETSTCYCD